MKRLEKLRAQVEERKYAAAVASVNRSADYVQLDAAQELRNTSTQLSLALNVLVSVVAVFVGVRWLAQQYHADDSRMPLVWALAASVAILLVETALFILHMTSATTQQQAARHETAVQRQRRRKALSPETLARLLATPPPESAQTSSAASSSDH